MSKKRWNILIFPGGMENGLEIQKSLRFCKEIKLFSATSMVMNHAFYTYKNNSVIKDIFTEGWVDDLNSIIEKDNIDLVFPANSLIIDKLHEKKDKINCEILMPSDDVLRVTRSKKETLKILQDVLPTPKTYSTALEVLSFPVFSKPEFGYGAQGALMITNKEHLSTIDFSKNLVSEYLPGKEYTIDCFSNNEGVLLFCSGRERSRIRMATSMHAEDVSVDLQNIMTEYALKILQKISISGAWFFQLKEDANGDLKLLEIDVRIAGTMVFNRCKGVNFPLLSVYNHFKSPVDILVNNVNLTLDRCLKNRFRFSFDYNQVYVDLDDTLIIQQEINTELISFLYQCINKGIKISLITKYIGENLKAHLMKYKVSEIFDEVIWINEVDQKYRYIKNTKSIFIDDSFSQRKEVQQQLGIPTFDPSMVESLIDDRY